MLDRMGLERSVLVPAMGAQGTKPRAVGQGTGAVEWLGVVTKTRQPSGRWVPARDRWALLFLLRALQ